MGSYQVVDCRGADEMARVERAIERAAHRGSLDEAERVEDAAIRTVCTNRCKLRKRPDWALTPGVRVAQCVRMQPQQRTHISVQDAATLLGESRWTTRRRIRSGELPAETVGSTFILDRADVVKLAERVAAEAAAKAATITAAIAGASRCEAVS